MKKSTLIIIVLIGAITAFGFGAYMESNKLDDNLIAAEIELSTITTCHDSAKKNIDKYSEENENLKASNEKMNNELNEILTKISIYEDRKNQAIKQSENETNESNIATVESTDSKISIDKIASTYTGTFELAGFKDVSYTYDEQSDKLVYTIYMYDLLPSIYEDVETISSHLDSDVYYEGYHNTQSIIKVYDANGNMIIEYSEGIYTVDYVPVQ